MSFLYSRTISIRRLKTEAVQNQIQQVGLLGYSGAEQSDSPSDASGEQILFNNIPCSIQAEQSGRTKDGYLPTDVTQKPTWLIIIPRSALPQYSVRDRDIVVDDEGYRYGVASNWFTPLGYNLTCVRMEA
jgi:hypothetical protein